MSRTALIAPQFYCADASNCEIVMVPTVNATTGQHTFVARTAWDYVHTQFGYEYDVRWYYTLSTAMFAVAYRIVAMLAVRYISYLKR